CGPGRSCPSGGLGRPRMASVQSPEDKLAPADTPALAPYLAGTLGALVRSLRPHQRVKNTLVLGGLIFSRSLLQWGAVERSLGALAAFCRASSAAYLLNDLRDLHSDRRHPLERLRPLASGALHPALAAVTMVLLLAAAVLMALLLRPAFALIVVVYLLMNAAY